MNSRSNPSSFRETFIHLFVPEKDPSYIYFILGIITLAGLILRLYIINNPIGYDEAYTFINFSSRPFKFILADYHAPNNHILNSLLIGIVYRILGNHIWIVRVPAFLASLLGIPAAYIAARRFFSPSQALAASLVLAVVPDIFNEAANGRGYPLVMLFSLLLVNFASILINQQNRSALTAYAITGALGFYSIPIFLYPMAGISLWVATTYLIADEPWKNKWGKLRTFLITCAASGILTFILYSPVIFFGTGIKSLVANDIVKSQTWHDFGDNFTTRTQATWNDWIKHVNPFIKQALTAGFLLSVFLYRKVSSQKLPLQLLLVAGAGIMLVLQRVAPLPRIWNYLEMFYLIFAAAGLAWLGYTVAKLFANEQTAEKIIVSCMLFTAILVFANITIKTQNKEALADRTVAPEQFAAEYIVEHIKDTDTLIAPAPVDLQAAYYLKIMGVPYDVFYQRDHPVEIENALIIIRTRGDGKIKSVERLLRTYKLSELLNIDADQIVFEYGPIQIHSIPAKGSAQ